MSGSWLEWFRAVYPVIVSIIGLAAVGCVLWLGTKFAAKSSLDKIAAITAEHETRLKLLEDHIESEPTRQQLGDEIAALAERVAGVESGMKGLGKQLDTANSYLKSLLDNAIAGGRPK